MLLPNAYDWVVTTLGDIGLDRVTADIRNVAPPCILVDPPTVTSLNLSTAQLDVPINVLGVPPATQQCITEILTRADSILMADAWLIVDAKPTTYTVGQQELPAYTVTVRFGYTNDPEA